MKRSAIVVLILVAGVTAMIWSGVMAYRMRKAMNTPPAAQTTSPQLQKFLGEPSVNSGNTAAKASSADQYSPAAQGLPDFREKAAPSFTLKSVDGKTVSLSDYKGKAVLLNFWATWCGPCKVEMPWLIQMQKKYASQGFTVLGISEDDGSTQTAATKEVKDFMAKMGVDYPVLMYDDQLNKAYGGIDYLPTSYYIGRDGKVVIESGGLISESEMEANIQKILAPASAANTQTAAATAVASDDGLPNFRGQQAPAFTLKTPDGKLLSLADYKGKAVLLNFWGTWCAPCKLELPWLIELQKKYAAQGFTVLGVAENEDSAKNVSDFATKMKVDYPLVMGDDMVNKAYKCCDFVPTSYYIGRDGKVMVEAGGLISESEMEANIHKILATGA